MVSILVRVVVLASLQRLVTVETTVEAAPVVVIVVIPLVTVNVVTAPGRVMVESRAEALLVAVNVVVTVTVLAV